MQNGAGIVRMLTWSIKNRKNCAIVIKKNKDVGKESKEKKINCGYKNK
jgi:hypothetical protein